MPNATTFQWFKRKLLTAMAGLGACGVISGCRVGMLLGLLIVGPPTIEPEFERQTKESLSEKGVTVAVICFAPTEVRYSFENIDSELAKYVALRLHENKIKVIHPDRVKAWLDEHKDDWDKPDEIGQAFKADYVISIDINEFSLYEEGSATLYRGRSESMVNVWKMDEDYETGEKIFSIEKISHFPSQHPISTAEDTYANFKGRYLSRLSEEIGWFFTEHAASDEIGGSN